MTDVRVLGIRHHGPGSARSVLAAFEQWQPDLVLIEGPPEADALVALAADPALVPPVAVLAYRNDSPAVASFWPFAVFSPEWQAVRWAVDRQIRVSFMDLPAAVVLADRPGHGTDDEADEPAPVEPEPEAAGPEAAGPEVTESDPAVRELDVLEQDHQDEPVAEPVRRAGRATLRTDPIALLAAAAGDEDPERWWEDVVESRGHGVDGGDPFEPFTAVTEAMTAVRDAEPETDARTLQREAHMRKVLRAAMKSGSERIAVVCGAWHAPALTGKLPAATADAKLLRGLPTAKVTATWVPWTHSRLAARSGYGAGVESPGWYGHLFTATAHPIERWMTEAAGVLRAHDIPTSTAHVIEAVRLADALAALRHRPAAGLTEVTDATLAVLCEGNRPSLSLVQAHAVVGERLGTVPDSAPMVPLDADLRATARSLRLKFEASAKELVLDLRSPNDLRKSELLHRLSILDVGWGTPTEVTGTGTFKEGWTLQWHPELSVKVVEASLWGNTVPAAAATRLTSRADSLPRCTEAIASAITADLPEPMPELLRRLDRFAAGTADVALLLDALPALVHAARYGSVRGNDTAAIADVAQALLTRISAGLPAALGGLGEEAAKAMRQHLERTHDAVPLLPEGPARDGWYRALSAATDRRDLPPLLAGRLVRLLMDSSHLDRDLAADRLHAALSVGSSPVEKAQWAEGFTAGGALLLIHDRALLRVIDSWVRSLSDEEFLEVVPLLRRGFGTFAPAERGNLLRAARSLDGAGPATAAVAAHDWDLSRAAAALDTARLLLGTSLPESA